MRRDKHWFNGVKYAEEEIHRIGLKFFMNSPCVGDAFDPDAFDEGVDACVLHYIELEKKGLYCENRS